MRRKKAKTFNLPDELTQVATAYAEATGRSFSSLVEDLLRDHLKKSGSLPEPSPEQVMKRLRERVDMQQKKRARKHATAGEEV